MHHVRLVEALMVELLIGYSLVRVFEDRRSGRHVVSLRSRIAGPLLLAAALRTIVEWSGGRLRELRAALTGPLAPHDRAPLREATFTALLRIADADAESHRPSHADVAALAQAEEQFSALSRVAHVQCDYAAQFETERAHTGTCARMERHNFEVSHVGFGAYTCAAREGRFRNKRPRERVEYQQHVFVFFSFFNAGYKPNARSHNVTQEDIDHYLKYGEFLHGEWFEGGMRCPGGPSGAPRLQPEAQNLGRNRSRLR